MANCPVCSKELNLLNTPLLGASKLANGQKLCKPCYDRLCAMYDSTQIHSLTPTEVKQMFDDEDALVDKVIDQIVVAGFDRDSLIANWDSTELKYLPNELAADETIAALANGVYQDAGGVIVATNIRLFFIAKPPAEDALVTDFEWNNVESINAEHFSDGYSAIIVQYNGDSYAVENVNAEDADRFCNNVSANISGFGPQENDSTDNGEQQPAANIAEQDIPGQLEKYAALKDKGILTQEEFDAKKKKLLGL